MNNYKALKNLENKVVLITGASSGLGEQIAYQVAKRGAIVIVTARNLDKLKMVAKSCTEFHGKKAYAIRMDMSNPDDIENAVETIKQCIGKIDVLINNAGFGLMQNAIDFDMQQAEAMFRVNVLGMMYLTQYVALQMAEEHCGVIINIASMAGKIATPKSAIYSATKAAVIGYSNALRLELKKLGISVIVVNSGPIRTNFFNTADQTGNYLEKVKKIVLNPELVAEKIVKTIGSNKRELILPGFFKVADIGYALFPKLGDFLTENIFNKK
nr:SDR family oxidoreductase [uncultured Ligilactobacillus sp.]